VADLGQGLGVAGPPSLWVKKTRRRKKSRQVKQKKNKQSIKKLCGLAVGEVEKKNHVS